MLSIVIVFFSCHRAWHSIRTLPWVKRWQGTIVLFKLHDSLTRKLPLSCFMAEETKHTWAVERLVLSHTTLGGFRVRPAGSKPMIPSISVELPVSQPLMGPRDRRLVSALVGGTLPVGPPHMAREPSIQIQIPPFPSCLPLCRLLDFSDLQSPLL